MPARKDDKYIKRMAGLLRQGATLTDLSCPACASPLFRLKDGTLWCERDQKQVILVKEGQEPPKPVRRTPRTPLDGLEATLLAKVQDLQTKIQNTNDVEELGKLSKTLSELLDNLNKIESMKRAKRH